MIRLTIESDISSSGTPFKVCAGRPYCLLEVHLNDSDLQWPTVIIIGLVLGHRESQLEIMLHATRVHSKRVRSPVLQDCHGCQLVYACADVWDWGTKKMSSDDQY